MFDLSPEGECISKKFTKEDFADIVLATTQRTMLDIPADSEMMQRLMQPEHPPPQLCSQGWVDHSFLIVAAKSLVLEKEGLQHRDLRLLSKTFMQNKDKVSVRLRTFRGAKVRAGQLTHSPPPPEGVGSCPPGHPGEG